MPKDNNSESSKDDDTSSNEPQKKAQESDSKRKNLSIQSILNKRPDQEDNESLQETKKTSSIKADSEISSSSSSSGRSTGIRQVPSSTSGEKFLPSWKESTALVRLPHEPWPQENINHPSFQQHHNQYQVHLPPPPLSEHSPVQYSISNVGGQYYQDNISAQDPYQGAQGTISSAESLYSPSSSDHDSSKSRRGRRFRRRYDQIVRTYNCTFPGCNKSYGSLNHLNTHIVTKKHGQRKSKADFQGSEELHSQVAYHPGAGQNTFAYSDYPGGGYQYPYFPLRSSTHGGPFLPPPQYLQGVPSQPRLPPHGRPRAIGTGNMYYTTSPSPSIAQEVGGWSHSGTPHPGSSATAPQINPPSASTSASVSNTASGRASALIQESASAPASNSTSSSASVPVSTPAAAIASSSESSSGNPRSFASIMSSSQEESSPKRPRLAPLSLFLSPIEDQKSKTLESAPSPVHVRVEARSLSSGSSSSSYEGS